jgi:two-component system chemotaxis response regulator CheV
MSPAKSQKLFSDGSWVRVLTFDFNLSDGTKTELAINIQKIKEVVDVDQYNIQPLSQSYYPIVGLFSLRGVSVPVLDLNHFLSKQDKHEASTGNRRIIICEFQKLLLGILVSKTHKIRQFDNAQVQRVPEVLEGLPSNVFNGIVEVNNSFIKLLDIEYILTKLNVDIAPPANVPASVDLAGKLILIAEDSILFQKKLSKFFQDRGAKIVMAEDGQEGLLKLRSLKEKPDLIFSDIEMPKLNGIGMIRAIKSEEDFRNIPVIFNTSISNPGLIEDIQSEGLGDYIVKFDEEEIEMALKRVFS